VAYGVLTRCPIPSTLKYLRRITVEDNGVGFVLDLESGRAGGVGFGLVGITERVKLLGGRAQFRASPGKGTKFSLTFGD
jgi:signal transduction histidine kinase